MNRIILALDTKNLEEAISITNQIKDKIFTIKLGLEFFNAHGKEGVKKVNSLLTQDCKILVISDKLNSQIERYVKQ